MVVVCVCGGGGNVSKGLYLNPQKFLSLAKAAGGMKNYKLLFLKIFKGTESVITALWMATYWKTIEKKKFDTFKNPRNKNNRSFLRESQKNFTFRIVFSEKAFIYLFIYFIYKSVFRNHYHYSTMSISDRNINLIDSCIHFCFWVYHHRHIVVFFS